MTAFPNDTPPPDNADASDAQTPREGDSGAPGVQPVPPTGPHQAKAGSYFRNVRYVIALAVILMGGWFLYDGFVGYPEENRRFAELTRQAEEARAVGDEPARVAALDELEQSGVKEHSALDVTIQRALGLLLPPLGVFLLVRWLYISRGHVRLDEADVLHVPGHPPVPASAIVAIHDALWERKGISRIAYDLDGTRGTLRLDDFVYERAPIDAIHDRLVYLHEGRDETLTPGGRGATVADV